MFNLMVKRSAQLTAAFSALADATRREILERLTRRGETPVTTLAKPFQMSLPAISRHLRILEAARLIQRRREGRTHYISPNVAGLQAARTWIMRHARMWDAQFDALDQFLKTETDTTSEETSQ